MEKLVAVMLGDGFEPLEALAPIDVLRRGGMKVDTVSVMEGRQVTSAQGVTLYADAGVGDVDLMGFDMIVVPGGSGGVENLARCEPLAAALCAFMAEGRLVAAICAGPTILADLGLLEGRTATCYPGCEEGFPAGAYQAELGVHRDGNLITASGPGQALDFGLATLRALAGDATADAVAEAMLVEA